MNKYRCCYCDAEYEEYQKKCTRILVIAPGVEEECEGPVIDIQCPECGETVSPCKCEVERYYDK